MGPERPYVSWGMFVLCAIAVLFAVARPGHAQTLAASKEAPKAAETGAEAQLPASRDAGSGTFFLPFMAEEARKRGIELPLPFGIGLVYYNLHRDIEITDVRVGRNGAPPASVSRFANFGSTSNVNNVNLKLDVWLLPFLNVYAIAGYIWNESTTRIDVTLPPLLPGGSPRRAQLEVPTQLEGSVGGLGLTLAGGYGPFFMAFDVNEAKADLGFDDRFKAVITSVRAGWNGEVGSRPLRSWLNVTYWDTFAVAKGSTADPDGGTLSFEVDQGPVYAYTYGAGVSYSPRKWMELSIDVGTDFHGGWYMAVVPVVRL
jgi:hypothetical protein